MSSTTVTTTSSTPTTSTSTSASATSSDSNGEFTFIGNTPSSVLFFLALAVGVFIAFLFIFFTLRYFMRSKYGLHVYPVTQRGLFSSNNHTNTNILSMYHTNAELQEQLDYIREHHFVRSDVLIRRLDNRRRRRRRRRRNRFAKMKKLSESQVEKLFPKKTYHDWLNGGKERDNDHRDGVLREEEQEINKVQNPEIQESNEQSQQPKESVIEGEIEGEVKEENSNKINEITINEIGSSSNSKNQENIEMIDLTPAQNEDLHFTSGTCAICLEVIEDDEIVRGLLCGHVFHASCLDPWLTKRRACCPMCKRDYYYKDTEDHDSETTNNDSVNNDNDNDNDNDNEHDHNHEHLETTEVAETAETATARREAEEGGEGNNDTNTGEEATTTATLNTEARDDEESEDELIDLEALRSDPTLRAMLHELIPVDERVRMILSDESLIHLNFEQKGREMAKQKYSNIFKIIFWKLMGISKRDLFNYGVLTNYHDFRIQEEIRNNSGQPLPNLDSPQDTATPTFVVDSESPVTEVTTEVDEVDITETGTGTGLTNGTAGSSTNPDSESRTNNETTTTNSHENTSDRGTDLGESTHTAPSAISRDIVENRV